MGYVLTSGVPYGTYLQAQALIDDVTTSHARHTRAVVGEIRQSTRDIVLAADNHHVELRDAVSHGFSQVVWTLDRIEDAVQQLDVTFQWGFNAVLAVAGRMADSLEQLLAAVKTPTKTRAYEYFDDARLAFTRGHLRDALELVDKAILGDHTSSGYRLEWRFHLLRASVLVGSHQDPSLLDLPAAETSYMNAAKYASGEDPNGAATALLGAGWSCCCQGRVEEGLALTKQSIAVRPAFGEANFQAAKILMALGRVDEALLFLSRAIDSDPRYCIKAATDGDFQRQLSRLDSFLESERTRRLGVLALVFGRLVGRISFWTWLQRSEGSSESLARVMASTASPLLDAAEWLKALADYEASAKASEDPSFDAQAATRLVSRIPSSLELPQVLVDQLVLTASRWPLNDYYLDLADLLRSRGNAAAAYKILLAKGEIELKPLRYFASLLSADSGGGAATTTAGLLKRYLHAAFPGRRRVVIQEFDQLRNGQRYSVKCTTELGSALLGRYKECLSEISQELQHRAYAGTESPMTGVIGRTVGGFFASGFALIAVFEIMRSSGNRPSDAGQMIIWVIAVAAIVIPGIVRRSDVREKRLSAERKTEAELRSILRA